MKRNYLFFLLFITGILSVFTIIIPSYTELIQLNKKSDLRYLNGYNQYNKKCAFCHQQDGSGIKDYFPPLYNSDYLLKDKKVVAEVLIFGLMDTITVNGKTYSGIMHPVLGTDQDIADIFNYMYQEFGNNAQSITSLEISTIRQKGKEAKRLEIYK